MISFGASPLEVLAREAMIQGLVYCDEFTYSISFAQNTPLALGANADVTGSFNINSDSDFICQQYNAMAFAGGQVVNCPNIRITITRSGSGRLIMSNPIHLCNMFGSYCMTNSIVGTMPISSLYQGNMSVQIRLQNLSSTAFDFVDLSWRGFKVFYQTNQSGATGNRQDIFHAL